MSEIARNIPPIQAQSLDDLRREVEIILRRQQQEIWQLRQFIEPSVVQNNNCPDQQFNPLE